jgi:hypothetical protein
MRLWRNTLRGLAIALAAASMAGCAGMSIPGFSGGVVSAPFDQQAYQNAADVKALTLSVVDRAGDRYASRRTEAEALQAAIDRAYTYASAQPNNQLAIQAWSVVRNPQGGSVGEYLAQWQRRGTLPPAYRNEKRRQLAQQVDYVVCIEANKQNPTACANPFGGQF